MNELKRVYLFGAGFSKPAGLPLATELLAPLLERLNVEEIQDWLRPLQRRLDWLRGQDGSQGSAALNIEEVFHLAHFDIEVLRLQHHLSSVGRGDGPGTAWNGAETIDGWLYNLEEALRDEICIRQSAADMTPISRWAESVGCQDVVLTFNYDTLVEQAIASVGKSWNHTVGASPETGVRVCKLHGSIDWIVAHRNHDFGKCELLFDKQNVNRRNGNTGYVEDDYVLWRCRSIDQLQKWIDNRYLQYVPESAMPARVGIAGLGAYKPLHEIPGLGRVWANGMRSLYEAGKCIVVGFSMSDFDAMAKMQLANVAMIRAQEQNPLEVVVVDPYISDEGKARFRSVFRTVEFVDEAHESFNWDSI